MFALLRALILPAASKDRMAFHSTKHSRGWRCKAHKGTLCSEQLTIALHISGRGSRDVGGQAAAVPNQKFFTTKMLIPAEFMSF